MKGNIAVYMERAERLESIVPTVDPANGDMIWSIGPKTPAADFRFACRQSWARSSGPIFPR